MAHGTPDWGVTSGKETVFQLTDLAELAVRLGSIDSYDRGGDVLMLDDFESGLARWKVYTGGTGAAVAISTAEARSGESSVKLTGGSDGARSAAIRHTLPAQVLSAAGVECAFHLPLTLESIHWTIDVYNGTNSSQWVVRWVDSTNLLEVYDAALGWVTVATGLSLVTGERLFHVVKLVGDLAGGKYARLRFDDVGYGVGDYGPKVSVSAFGPMVQVTVDVVSRPGENDVIYVDDVIITQNEPV